MKDLLITIDGPAAAGKTIVSSLLAKELNYRHINTGNLYRALVIASIDNKININIDKEFQDFCLNLNLKKNLDFILANKNLELKSSEIGLLASQISAKSFVRMALLGIQREMGKDKRVVFEGRDMGTVVFPDADFKFFLTASYKIRAIRRFQELKQLKINIDKTLWQIEEEIKLRDKNDTERKIAPLKPAEKAIIIDSSVLSVQEIVNYILDLVK